MIARITPDSGECFYLHWDGEKAVADSTSSMAARCIDYLNGTPTLHVGHQNEGGTDGHYAEQRPLRSNDEFLLTVGSLADHFPLQVELLGELSDADHEEILNNPAADAALAKRAKERAIADGMSREQAERLYGIR